MPRGPRLTPLVVKEVSDLGPREVPRRLCERVLTCEPRSRREASLAGAAANQHVCALAGLSSR